LQAQSLIELRKIYPPQDIHAAAFKVFSQWGEDGIIQWIISKIPDMIPVFIEFGVENYQESNTRFLLMKNNWKGLIIDGSEAHMSEVKSRDLYWRHDLTAVAAFINKNNINALFENNGFTGDIGILSVDIDGNDYWVWDAVTCVNPQVVICEYNSLWGSEKALVIPYREDFFRTHAHYSNLYYGVSLKALELLAQKKGYVLIGSNEAGNNAFFVKKTYASLFEIQTAEKAFIKSTFRESRDKNGNLTYLSKNECLKLIRDMPLLNLETSQVESISKIFGQI
jgi:hypothetical protein